MKNLKRSEKILLLILTLAIVFYVYYTFLLSPVLVKISTSKDSIASYNQELNNIKLKESQIEKLKADYETYKNDYEKLVKRFPTYEKDPQIGYDLKILADQNKVQIQKQAYSAATAMQLSGNTSNTSNTASTTTANSTNTQKKERYSLNFVAVNMSISGSYESIKAFINSLENEDRSTLINNVNIQKTENSLSASITANFYFINDTQNADKNSYDFNNKNYGKTNFFN